MAKGAIYIEKHKDGKITTDVESIDGLIAYGMKLSHYMVDTDFKEDFKKVLNVKLSDNEIEEMMDRVFPYITSSLMACIDTALMDERVLPKMCAKLQSNPKYSLQIEDVQTGDAAKERYEKFKKEGK